MVWERLIQLRKAPMPATPRPTSPKTKAVAKIAFKDCPAAVGLRTPGRPQAECQNLKTHRAAPRIAAPHSWTLSSQNMVNADREMAGSARNIY